MEVKVQEPCLTVSHPCSPDGHASQKVCVDHHQLSIEDSSSGSFGDGFQDFALGPRNLQDKRIVAFLAISVGGL